jgi:trehalose synthase-fused probable maltokinase
MLTATHDWVRLFEGETAGHLMRALPDILQARRWFGGKARRIGKVDILDCIAIPSDSMSLLLLIWVEYEHAETETYILPVTAAFGDDAERIRREMAPAVIAPFVLQREAKTENGLLYDALWNRDFTLALLNAVSHESRFSGFTGSLIASTTNAFTDLMPVGAKPEPVVMGSEQSNTSVAYNGYVILKLYRRVEEGINPDLEMGRTLTRLRFSYVPLLAGALEYQATSGRLLTLCVLQQFVVNDGNAWQYGLEAVKRFFERVDSEQLADESPAAHVARPLELAREPYEPLARHLIGGYLEWAERLGQRTAQLHRALSQVADDPAFAPEPLTAQYWQTRHAAVERGMAEALMLLKDRRQFLSAGGQEQARLLFELKPVLERIISGFETITTSVLCIRCHGDYHLGQVLCTGDDFMIIDFEGEPARSLAERRMKHPVLLDIAGMIRSFHYVPFAFLKGQGLELSRWASYWSNWMSVAFLKGYLGKAIGSEFWPQHREHVNILLDLYLVEKAFYELRYELNNRPDWVEIPLYGLVAILKHEEHEA